MTVLADCFPAFESLDRIAITEMRPSTIPSGVVAAFYRLTRGPGDAPLTHQISEAVLGRDPGRALIVTGLVDPDRYPVGEINGPLGSVALARTLSSLGHNVTIVVEHEALEPISAVLASTGSADITLIAKSFDDSVAARAFGAQFDIVVAVEKLGRNENGSRHLIWGNSVEVGDQYADDYVLGAAEAGALTIGIGDNGNEIGFGNIRDRATSLTPAGVHVDGGFFAATRVDHLLPASVSNFGCYAIIAALAISSGRAELALDGGTVEEWTNTGLDHGLRSGGVDDPHFRGDDGVPLRFVRATVDMYAGVVHQALVSPTLVSLP